MYKLYCFILNNRISTWCEANGKIVDEQNGFRKNRSTIDHVSTLTSIVDTRKKLKQSTFCAFIDFRKAYDCINRNLLWSKLENIGIRGKRLRDGSLQNQFLPGRFLRDISLKISNGTVRSKEVGRFAPKQIYG